MSGVAEAFVKLTLSCPVQVEPLELLVRLTVYDGVAGVRTESARAADGADGAVGDAAWAAPSGVSAVAAEATSASKAFFKENSW
ncbi:hypothetical protein GCM10010151_28340 [Actinoallomurus spadix]|uniref:Uncharacterized protein n=1 Tax=Actinoallomurus spadix TaxID=79912 RepID=A0ABP3G5S3_9ACTN